MSKTLGIDLEHIKKNGVITTTGENSCDVTFEDESEYSVNIFTDAMSGDSVVIARDESPADPEAWDGVRPVKVINFDLAPTIDLSDGSAWSRLYEFFNAPDTPSSFNLFNIGTEGQQDISSHLTFNVEKSSDNQFTFLLKKGNNDLIKWLANEDGFYVEDSAPEIAPIGVCYDVRVLEDEIVAPVVTLDTESLETEGIGYAKDCFLQLVKEVLYSNVKLADWNGTEPQTVPGLVFDSFLNKNDSVLTTFITEMGGTSISKDIEADMFNVVDKDNHSKTIEVIVHGITTSLKNGFSIKLNDVLTEECVASWEIFDGEDLVFVPADLGYNLYFPEDVNISYVYNKGSDKPEHLGPLVLELSKRIVE